MAHVEREATAPGNGFRMMEMWTFVASIAGLWAFFQHLMPPEYRNVLEVWVKTAFNFLSPYAFFDVPEFYGAGGNEIYDYVQTYLSSSTAISAQHVNLCRPKNASQNTFSLANNVSIQEKFMGAPLWWTHHVSERQSNHINWSDDANDEKRTYTLKIRKSDKTRVLEPYVEHVFTTAKDVKEKQRDRLLYTNVASSGRYKPRVWESVPFKHPSTFDTLAMDPELKAEIKEDLEDFTKGKEFYQRAGKAWKRGYLLYGPPGTGKSSMIAAIANFLHYDVYDVELTEVNSNSELRKLLIQTTNRSVIVIEDIDCSIDLTERAKARKKEAKPNAGSRMPGQPDNPEVSKVTLSGLLNFTDGLWSCCGSERIIVFTTNHIDKLDPALLRSGRMDMHIHMSWCSFPAFRVLALNNLLLHDHPLFPALESAFAGKAITPADVSEILTRKKRDPTNALEILLESLATTKNISDLPAPAPAAALNDDQTSEDDSPPTDDNSDEVAPEIKPATEL